MAQHARAGRLRLCVSVLQYLGQYASVPIVQQQKGQEAITGELQQAMRMLLKAYNRRNGHLPRQFVVRPRLCLCAAAPCEAHHAPRWAAGSSPQHLICTGRYLFSNVEGLSFQSRQQAVVRMSSAIFTNLSCFIGHLSHT